MANNNPRKKLALGPWVNLALVLCCAGLSKLSKFYTVKKHNLIFLNRIAAVLYVLTPYLLVPQQFTAQALSDFLLLISIQSCYHLQQYSCFTQLCTRCIHTRISTFHFEPLCCVRPTVHQCPTRLPFVHTACISSNLQPLSHVISYFATHGRVGSLCFLVCNPVYNIAALPYSDRFSTRCRNHGS